MWLPSRLFASTLLSIGLVALALESGGGPARAWTLEGPSRRAEAPSQRRAAPDAATRQRVNDQYGRLPLSFEQNAGQTDPRVDFLSRGPGYALFLSAGGKAVLALSGAPGAARAPLDPHSPVSEADPRNAARPAIAETGRPSRTDVGAALRLTMVGANHQARAEGREALPGTVNYLKGTDRTQWRAGITTYARVAYDDIYPGIELVYYGNQRQLEYDFIVQPGADPRVITLKAEGADRLEVNAGGDLVLHVGGREVRQQKPVVYQEVEGVRQVREGRYALQGSGRVTFELGAYDPTRALVIDPVLVYSTYLGGALSVGASENASDVAIDAAGQAYVTGFTQSSDFPTTVGAYDTSHGGGYADVFVTKLDAGGATLAYSTFLGGSNDDGGSGVAVDGAGQAYVTGYTLSSDFPTTAGAFDPSWNYSSDLFVTKLNAAGAMLVYSTFLGGSNVEGMIAFELGVGVAVDAAGNAYVSGSTVSGDFPTTVGAYDTSFNGRADVFVTKLDATGATLAYSTFLGGTVQDFWRGVAVDAAGNVYVTGIAGSGFPTTVGAYDTSYNGGGWDVFMTKLDASGATLAYSTFLGGSSDDRVAGVAVDAAGQAYVTGFTESNDFPTTVGTYDTSLNGGIDVFVTKLDASGATLAYSTFLGGSSDDRGSGVAVDGAGNAYVTGQTASSNFPTTVGAYDTSFTVGGDGFVTKLDAAGATLAYSTFLAASPQGVAVDGAGNAYVTGSAGSGFPTTVGAYDTSYNGLADVFVTKLNAAGSAPLVYSTYLGGNLRSGGDDSGLALAVDGTGSAYVTGSTISPDFPTTVGAQDTSWNGQTDVFVTKLDAAGATLAYSTFLGGGSDDRVAGIAVDGAGHAYVTGSTNSSDFPTTVGAYDTRYNGPPGSEDVFVTKLDAAGATLAYSTFLGGTSHEVGSGVAVDGLGNAYVTGYTQSSDFPMTVGAYDTSFNGDYDVFVTKLDAAGATLAYSTFLGGSDPDIPGGVAVDVAGNAYVTGWTWTSGASDFPTTVGAYDTSGNGGGDVFVTKLDASGATLAYSTFLGGSSDDNGAGVAVDGVGNAYVTGYTSSSNFPTTVGAYDTSFNGDHDVLVTKLGATGATLAYSTFLGGSAYDVGNGVAIDGVGNAYVTGSTQSSDFPTTPGAFDPRGSSDAFVTKLHASGATRAYSTLLGGSSGDSGEGVAVDGAGNAYVTGATSSRNFPTTLGAYDTSGSGDAFVTKLSEVGPPAPRVILTANGTHGPLTLGPGDPLAIAVSFDAGSFDLVDPAEVYIGVFTPAGLFWFDPTSRTFVPTLTRVYAGPLASFGPAALVNLPNVSVLVSGRYQWFMLVDHDSNGEPDGPFFDLVLTTVS